jgi:WhiB family redox-sensing transcriptional regulator
MAEHEQTWRRLAACRGTGPSTFFADPADPGAAEAVAAAKSLCARCPVRHSCLSAGAGEPFGTWGGLTAPERRLCGQGGRAA